MRRHKSDRFIGVLTVALLGVGLIVIYAIGPMRANVMNSVYGNDIGENEFFFQQLRNVILSLVAVILAFKIPYKYMRKYAKFVMFGGLFLCLLLAILAAINSPLARCELGACRWYNLGGFSLQPAEILKLGLIAYLAQLVAERKEQGKLNSSDFWIPFGVVSILSLVFVVVLQKDLGTGVALVAIILAMLFMSGVKLWQFAIVVVIVIGGGLGSILVSPHRMERLKTFNSAESSDAYHIENAMIAIGTGGMTGVGIGNSVQATGYLPESINDSVFAILGETFGFVGLVTIIGCFTVLLLRLLRVANHLEDEEESLVVVGVFAWVMAHVVVNIASMTGLIPLTGITLPLLSYGGTSMIFTALAIGVALQLSCYTSRDVRKPKPAVTATARPSVARRRLE